MPVTPIPTAAAPTSAVLAGDERPVLLHHLLGLTTPTGLWEHALGTEPRVEHGMCVDDVARALVVTSRATRQRDTSRQAGEPTQQHDETLGLARIYLRFVREAQRPGGLLHNRRSPAGAWLDTPSSGDHWGRALWALGAAAARLPDGESADDARRGRPPPPVRARRTHARPPMRPSALSSSSGWSRTTRAPGACCTTRGARSRDPRGTRTGRGPRIASRTRTPCFPRR